MIKLLTTTYPSILEVPEGKWLDCPAQSACMIIYDISNPELPHFDVAFQDECITKYCPLLNRQVTHDPEWKEFFKNIKYDETRAKT